MRRLLRRVIRAMRLLGVQDPVLGELLPVSRDLMRVSYPDIDQAWERVSQSAQAEEETFRRTLASGTVMFDTAVTEASRQVHRAARRQGPSRCTTRSASRST